MMNVYRGYRHFFISDLKLSIPDIIVDKSTREQLKAVRIRLFESGQVGNFLPKVNQDLREYGCFDALDVGLFEVSQGNNIDIYPRNGVTGAVLEMWIYGVVMSTLMYQRGFFTLHACAMQVNGKVIAFIGNIGFGKSTLTASLLGRGHGFLADDLTVFDFSSGFPCVLPGFPILKLTPEVAERTGFGHDRLLGQHPYKGKALYHVAPVFGDGPLRLDHLFVLDRGPWEFRTVPAFEAFVQLNANSLPTGRGLMGDRQHFEHCSMICKNVPITIFRRPFNMDDLNEQAKQLEAFLSDERPRKETAEAVDACCLQ